MKKVIFTLMGLCTLIACSNEDFVETPQQAEEQDHNMYSPLSFDPQDPNNYFSPWDIWKRNEVLDPTATPPLLFTPVYTFTNNSGFHASPYFVYAYAYVGLAYYDGVNDGLYHDSKEAASNPPGRIADLTNGLYPNLFQNGQEVGNFIRVDLPIKLDGSYINGSECAIMSHTDHLPINRGNLNTGGFPGGAVNPIDQFFDLQANSVATPAEQLLLQEYGKVFYYEVLVEDAFANKLFHGILVPEVNNITNANWKEIRNVANNANLSTIIPPAPYTPSLSADLYYYEDTSLGSPGTKWDPDNGIYECDSREVVLDLPTKLNYFKFATPTGDWEVSLKITQGNTNWFGSTLWLDVKPTL